MPSNIWKKTADGLPPADDKRYVLAISKNWDCFPVIEKYVYRPRYGEWQMYFGYFPLSESLYWAYEDELALEVLGEY